MSMTNLDRLFAAANTFDASDLHLVGGVPPAFRVNGEIIIADEDALTQAEVADTALLIAAGAGDRGQFQVILAPEEATEIGRLRG